MDEQKRASLLDQLAEDAGRKREAFLDEAGRQFARFLDGNKYRLKDLGGLVLIDDGPDYLFVTEEGTFRSRTRFQDDDGEWVSETEEIENGADLVEVFNPADLYAAFVDAAKDEGRLDEAEEAETDDAEAADAGAEADEVADELDLDEEPEADGDWIDAITLDAPRDQQHAARLMYDLALTFQEGSQVEQARLLDDFQLIAAPAAELLGDSKFVEDDDERLWLRATGALEGEVVPEREDGEKEPDWQPLTTPEDMVLFYDPTDLFGDLAEAIAESYPEAAPEFAEGDGDGSVGDAADAGESNET